MGYEDKKLKIVGTRPIRPDGADKVTGRANYAADHVMPGMLVGKFLRSPHAHAKIKSINIDKALALPGVKAIITGKDIRNIPDEIANAGEGMVYLPDLAANLLAKGKVLYDGHPVAAVAATTSQIADKALSLIKVDYQVLKHVMTVEEAMAPKAPLLHSKMITKGVDPAPKKASNVASTTVMARGDLKKGFKDADVIIERTYKTKPVHQGYIEPHACVANITEDGQATVWCSSQGHFVVRDLSAKIVGMDIGDVRVIPAEIGGGFGGKTTVYLEPIAIMLSKASGRPVKMVMTRAEVFRATGPTSGGTMDVKLGAKKDGTITAGEVTLAYEAGAFPGSPAMIGCMCAFSCYDIENVSATGHDVVVNRPKVAAYRAPGAPQISFAVESAVDELAKELNMDGLSLRQKNIAKEGDTALYGATHGPIGALETVNKARDHQHYKSNLGPDQGRGTATGFWFNIGGNSSATVNVNEDGTVTIAEGNPDIGGSRASMAMMVAEVLGIKMDKVSAIIPDTASIGFNDVTGGSRVTFATGWAATNAAEDVVRQLRERAAKVWEVDVDKVTWENGAAKTKGQKAMTLPEMAAKFPRTGGPIVGQSSINAQGAGPAFGTHICDVEVDRETGKVTVLRYTAVQDAGKAIHPSYVEGQIQGGAVQGIGWALNEEYIVNDKGQLENPGFLDYRMPVASDLPMIDAVIVEIPNPVHPFGVRGVGEVPIVPPLAAVANAIEDAVGVRVTELPISPPVLLAAIKAAEAGK